MSWKEKLKYIWIGSALGGSLFLGYLFLKYTSDKDRLGTVFRSEEGIIYEGEIGGKEIIYLENSEVIVDNKKRKANAMIIRHEEDSVELIDYENQKSIEWKLNTVPAYKDDSLERVIIRAYNGEHVFTANQAKDDTSIGGQSAKELINQANVGYNKWRTDIRDRKRTNYTEQFKGFKDLLTPR